MAQQTIKTRVRQKHETSANWSAATGFKPLAGELIVYDADSTQGPRLKIGDETTAVTDLPFVEAVPTGVFGVCDTAADVATKTVTIDGFKLKVGAVAVIKFTYANDASSPTLNINGTGDIPMYRYGSTAISTATTTSGWTAGAVQMFIYDGSGWTRDYWSNTTYSNAGLGQAYVTCSTAASTAAKTASSSSYALTTGGIVSVKFSNDVPANATLNINSKGAKNIYFRGAKITAGIIKAGDIATFIYSSYYHLISIDRWQNDITTHTGDTTSHITSTERTNWTAAKTHADSAHAPSNAEKNQNAFSNVKVDSTTIAADTTTDTLTLVAGSNVTITPDATNDKITIAATDTTYSAATTGTAGLMSADDKTKLDGIATGANKYSHPTTSGNKHIPSGGSSGQILRWSADGTAAWGADNNTTYSAATQSAAGLMSAADKTKLDGIATGANNYTYTLPAATSSTLGGVKTGSNITNSSGTISLTKSNVTSALGYTPPTTDTTYSAATTSTAGLMSASDKSKLDGITSSADSVSFSASATSGNKVGEITINGTKTNMYSPTQTSVSGNAGTATKLATARTLTLGGDLSGSVSFNGAADKDFDASLGKEWTAVTTVNAYSRLCKLSGYGNWILTIELGQNSQVSYHVFLIGLGYESASITQLGGSGFTAYAEQTIRIARDAAVQAYVELLNTYGYNGATTVSCSCKLIPLSASAKLTEQTFYTEYNAGAATTVFSQITTSGYGITTSKINATNFIGNLTGNASTAIGIKNSYTTRPSSADLTITGDGTISQFKATSTMKEHSSYPGVDAHVLHFEWDNTGGYNNQLALPTNDGASIRYRQMYNGTWRNWKTVPCIDYVTGSGSISVTLVDNTEYRYTSVTKLTLTYPSGNFESWIRFTVGTSANATVSFPSGTTYIGDSPTAYEKGKTYEISIKDKVAIIKKVG